MYARFIGIAYSGAEAPVSRLRGLQVYAADGSGDVTAVPPFDRGARNWCRKEIFGLLRERLAFDEPCIIGMGHGFSFPEAYFRRHALDNWEAFLRHFCEHWPTANDHMYVDFVRCREPLQAAPDEGRLCDDWTAPSRSVGRFDVHEPLAKATHAGIPWLKRLRDDRKIRARTHFWPFDGFAVEPGRSVIAEIHPALFHRRYPRADRNTDQQDAYAAARWLKDMHARGALSHYFNPPLTLPERRRAQIEGWILGVR